MSLYTQWRALKLNWCNILWKLWILNENRKQLCFFFSNIYLTENSNEKTDQYFGSEYFTNSSVKKYIDACNYLHEAVLELLLSR